MVTLSEKLRKKGWSSSRIKKYLREKSEERYKDAEKYAKRGSTAYFKGTRSKETIAVAKAYGISIKTGKYINNDLLNKPTIQKTTSSPVNIESNVAPKKETTEPFVSDIMFDYEGATGSVTWVGGGASIMINEDTWDKYPSWVKKYYELNYDLNFASTFTNGNWTTTIKGQQKRVKVRSVNPMENLKAYFSSEEEVQFLSNMLDPLLKDMGWGTIEDQMQKIENMGEPWKTVLHPDTTIVLFNILMAVKLVARYGASWGWQISEGLSGRGIPPRNSYAFLENLPTRSNTLSDLMSLRKQIGGGAII